MIDISKHTMEALVGVEIPVGNAGFVRLIDWMGGDHSVVQGARMSYGKGTRTTREDKDLIDFLWRNHHASPFELASIALNIRLPIFVMRQLARYRTAKLNEYSMRYSVAIDDMFVPDEWRANTAANKQSSEGICDENGQLTMVYDLALDSSKDAYNLLIDNGVAREQARCVLPVAQYTEIVWKMDLRNMLNFLRQRLHHHAQKEIRDFAEVIAEIVKKWCPLSYAAFEEHTLESMTLSRSEIKLVHYLNTMDANGLHTHLQYPEALSTINTLKEMGVIGEEYNLYSKRTKTQDLLAKLDTLGLCGMLSWFLHQFKDLHESITKGEQE